MKNIEKKIIVAIYGRQRDRDNSEKENNPIKGTGDLENE